LFRVLKKRDTSANENILDVRTDINTLDINDQDELLPSDLRHRAHHFSQQHPLVLSAQMADNICMSSFGVSTLVLLAVLLVAALVAAAGFLFRPTQKL
jgi:hypothetical protein